MLKKQPTQLTSVWETEMDPAAYRKSVQCSKCNGPPQLNYSIEDAVYSDSLISLLEHIQLISVYILMLSGSLSLIAKITFIEIRSRYILFIDLLNTFEAKSRHQNVPRVHIKLASSI